MSDEDINFLISIQDLEQPEFDNACLERENKRLTKEIDRLNKIIEELEKELRKDMEVYICGKSNGKTFRFVEKMVKAYYLDKLKELKEGSEDNESNNNTSMARFCKI